MFFIVKLKKIKNKVSSYYILSFDNLNDKLIVFDFYLHIVWFDRQKIYKIFKVNKKVENVFLF